MHKENQIQWQPIIELSIVLFTILGSTIPLYLHTDGKMEIFQARNYEILEAITKDIRDFHGKLERQDAEFKGKMALQDAEFKAHMMRYHEKG